MRGDAAADVEIRRLAVAVYKLLKDEAPNLFGDYTLVDLPEGARPSPPNTGRSSKPRTNSGTEGGAATPIVNRGAARACCSV